MKEKMYYTYQVCVLRVYRVSDKYYILRESSIYRVYHQWQELHGVLGPPSTNVFVEGSKLLDCDSLAADVPLKKLHGVFSDKYCTACSVAFSVPWNGTFPFRKRPVLDARYRVQCETFRYNLKSYWKNQTVLKWQFNTESNLRHSSTIWFCGELQFSVQSLMWDIPVQYQYKN